MRKLQVHLTWSPDEAQLVGHLAERGRRVFFEYDPAFLQDPVWLSPFKVPPQAGLLEHVDRDFGPIFGLFDDSLPDGWGLLLMDRYFQSLDKTLAEVSVLDRLAFLGTRTMGALTYHPPTSPATEGRRDLDLHEMARASEQVLSGSSRELLPRLLRAGGSPGGARPKVLVGVCGDEILSGEEDLPSGFEHWMVKFGGPEDLADVGAVEMAYSRMAREAGIDMPKTRLFETSQRGRFFGVKRFDREHNRRFHMHTFGNLIHSNYRLPSCDYLQLLKTTKILTRDHQQVQTCFRRMVFNVLAHNRDDHVKNFAFRLAKGGEWELSPAYDLVPAPGPGGEHSMTIDGEGSRPTWAHMLKVAAAAGVSKEESRTVRDEVIAGVENWSEHAEDVGVSLASRRTVEVAIQKCLAHL